MAIATSAMVVFERRKMRASGTLAEPRRGRRARECHVRRRARGERASACSSDACAERSMLCAVETQRHDVEPARPPAGSRGRSNCTASSAFRRISHFLRYVQKGCDVGRCAGSGPLQKHEEQPLMSDMKGGYRLRA